MSQQEKQQNGGSSSFAVMVRRAAGLADQQWTDERIAVIHRTIAPEGAGAAEVAMFLAVADRYQLDPFAKEIWLAKDKGRIIILTGRDAIVKVGRSNPDYRGYEADVVYSKDAFQAKHEDGEITIRHEIPGFDRGQLLGAYCLVRKQGHPPMLVMRRWDQYQHLHHKDNWKNYGEDMLLSRVITAAHRLLYNISGMYTPEEMESGEAAQNLASHEVAEKTKGRLEQLKQKLSAQPEDDPADDVREVDFEIVQEEKPKQEAKPAAEAPTEQPAKAEDGPSDHERARGRFWALYKEQGYSTDDMAQEEERKAWLEGHFGKRSFGQLSTEEIRVAIGLLETGMGPEKPGAQEAQPATAGADFPGGLPGDGLPFDEEQGGGLPL